MMGAVDGLVPMRDDGLVLRGRDGLFVYTIDRQGTLVRVGKPADYLPFLRSEGDEELIGLEPPDPSSFEGEHDVISGTIERPFVRAGKSDIKHGRAPVLVWSGSGWTKAEEAPAPEVVDSDSGDQVENARAEGLPANHVWQIRHTTKSAIVWLGHPQTPTDDSYHPEYVTAVAPGPGKPARLIDVPDPLAADGGTPARARLCQPVSSADDGTYIRCSFVAKKEEPAVERFYGLDGGRWAPVGPPVEIAFNDRFMRRPAIVDAEGAVWYVEDRTPPRLTRMTRSGEVTVLDLPRPPSTPVAPSYDARLPENRPEGGTPWRTTTLTSEPLPTSTHVGTLHARRSGDVWAIGFGARFDPRSGTMLVRFARGPDPDRSPVLVRSGADERNEVLNARAIRRWAGHCNSVFVPLDEASYERHKDALLTAISKLGKEPVEVAMVKGSFDGRPATGMIFLRAQEDARLRPMEVAVERVITIATNEPVSPPDVTCSVPTLDRVVARLHWPR